MPQDKIVFFEEINSAWYPIVRKRLNDDFLVYFFKISEKRKRKRAVKRYLEANRLADLSQLVFDYVSVYKQASFYAHENVDYIFNKYF